MKAVKNIFFLGIGGIGMSALAKYFLEEGFQVYGYDAVESELTNELQGLGAKIVYEDLLSWQSELNQENTLVVRTPAVPVITEWYQYFNQNEFRMLKRAEILGEISRNSICVAIAGTHGKTTISSMVANIFNSSDHAFAAFLGGVALNFNSNYISRKGENAYTIVEADEFDRSFLKLNPQHSLISNIDPDHLDIYKDEADLKEAFGQFKALTTDTLVVNESVDLSSITYGKSGKYSYEIFEERIGLTEITFTNPKGEKVNIDLPFNGEHNVINALGAYALCSEIGVNPHAIKAGLSSFKGIARRFNIHLNEAGKVYIDDYAHHPSEIKACYHALKRLFPMGKIVAAFQPHLFSRTQDFADDFAKELSQFDEVVLLDIYPARELPIEGVTSDWLSSKMTTVVHRAQLNNCVEMLTNIEAQVYVTIGAGSIGTKVKEITNKLKEI